MARLLALWGPVALFMAAVLLIPGSAVEPVHQRIWDKASHAVAFAVYGAFCIRAFHGGAGPLRRNAMLAALVFALSFAAFDEWRQTWLPDRFGTFSDWIADAVGVLSSAAGYAWFRRRDRSRQAPE